MSQPSNIAKPSNSVRLRQAVQELLRLPLSATIGTASVLLVLVLWQVFSTYHIVPTLFFSSPLAVAHEAVLKLDSQSFWSAASRSAYEFGIGYGLSVLVGIPIGLLNGWNRTFRHLADPWLNFLYSLPRIALAPLLLIIFGIGPTAIIAVVFLGAIFEIILNTSHGAQVVDGNLLDVAQTFGASKRSVITQILVPTSIPFMLVGLRLGVGRALIGVIIGELFVGANGLGHNIFLASQALKSAKVVFLVIFFLVIALLMTALLQQVESRFTSWRTDIGAR